MKLHFFDIDETTFFTEAKIKVLCAESGVKLRELTNAQFNEYEILDFSQFVCSKFFTETSTPNVPIIKIIKELFAKGENIYFLTARESLDNKEMFLTFMRSRGLPVGHKDEGLIHILRAGDDEGLNNAEKKKRIVRNIMLGITFDEVNLYDDAVSNLNAFSELQHEFPETEFNAFLVKNERISKF